MDSHFNCAKCGPGPLLTAVTPPPTPEPPKREGWRYTPLGRVCVGLILAQGLAYGLRMLANAGMVAFGDESPQAIWTTLAGLIAVHAMHGLGLLLGGTLAGAGQKHGTWLGGMVGLLNALVVFCVQRLNEEPVTEVLLYGVPCLYVAFGLLGGFVGSLVWKPLPTLRLAAVPEESKPPSARPAAPARTGPVAWGRVLIGTAVVLAGIFWPKVLLEFVLDASQGKMNVTSHLQAELVTWEVTALVVLVGAGLAGVNTFSGAKQGACVGVGAALCFLGAQAGGLRPLAVQQQLLTLLVVITLSVVGAWFGAAMFPPVVPASRLKRLRDS
jgi:hypothetical protein